MLTKRDFIHCSRAPCSMAAACAAASLTNVKSLFCFFHTECEWCQADPENMGESSRNGSWDGEGGGGRLTHWWSQERCAHCSKSWSVSFAKRENVHLPSSTPEDTALMLSNSAACVWWQRSNTKWINVRINFRHLISKKTCVSYCLSSGLSWNEI